MKRQEQLMTEWRRSQEVTRTLSDEWPRSKEATRTEGWRRQEMTKGMTDSRVKFSIRREPTARAVVSSIVRPWRRPNSAVGGGAAGSET